MYIILTKFVINFSFFFFLHNILIQISNYTEFHKWYKLRMKKKIYFQLIFFPCMIVYKIL